MYRQLTSLLKVLFSCVRVTSLIISFLSIIIIFKPVYISTFIIYLIGVALIAKFCVNITFFGCCMHLIFSHIAVSLYAK